MTLVESINRTRDLAGMKPLSEAQVTALNEAKVITITTSLSPELSIAKEKAAMKKHGVTLVKHSKGTSQGPKGFDEITVSGTEENLRKFYAAAWDMAPDDEEVDELFN